MLDDKAVDMRVPAALKAASELVEYAAYEMARNGNSNDVATLILLAADLERRGVQIAVAAGSLTGSCGSAQNLSVGAAGSCRRGPYLACATQKEPQD